jgi:putative hydrolases of HD superfamily
MMPIERRKPHGKKKRRTGFLHCYPSEQGRSFRDLWNEFEAAASPEARFAKAVDRFVAVLHNYETHGRGWSDNGIKRNRVFAVNEYVKNGSTILWEKIQSFIEAATREGFLQQ